MQQLYYCKTILRRFVVELISDLSSLCKSYGNGGVVEQQVEVTTGSCSHILLVGSHWMWSFLPVARAAVKSGSIIG